MSATGHPQHDQLNPDELVVEINHGTEAQDVIAAAKAGLQQHGAENDFHYTQTPLSIAFRAPSSPSPFPSEPAPPGPVLAALVGTYEVNYLHIHLLHISSALRLHGLGTRLMQTAEREARAKGCAGIYLDTFGFQARGFYEGLGYEVWGQLEGWKRGKDEEIEETRYFLRKMLK